MSKWSHLSNAVHIDRVIASVKLYPDKWAACRRVVSREETRRAAWRCARSEIRQGLWEAAWYAAKLAAWVPSWKAAPEAVWSAASAILSLIAYDDCAYMLDSEVGELRILAALGDTKAILLLPACVAFHVIKELENAN